MSQRPLHLNMVLSQRRRVAGRMHLFSRLDVTGANAFSTACKTILVADNGYDYC